MLAPVTRLCCAANSGVIAWYMICALAVWNMSKTNTTVVAIFVAAMLSFV